MTWTYAELKLADAAAGANEDLTVAAAAMNMQTSQVTVDVPIGDVEAYALINGITVAAQDWLAASGAGNVTVARVVRAFLAMIASQRLETVQMTDPEKNATVTQMLGAMTAVGILSTDQEAAILGMATATVPKWNPPVSAGDIQTARAQP